MTRRRPTSTGRRAAALGALTRTTAAAVLLVALAACIESSGAPAPRDAGRSRSPSERATATRTPLVAPAVNGRITSVQGHLRTQVGSYYWLDFDGDSDTGLFVSYGFCRHCRRRGIEVARFTVVGPAGPVATIACSDGPPCRARAFGNAATLGPGPDEVTVESGDRTMAVIGHDGALRRTIDLGATLRRRHDIEWLAWSPDGSRLAVLAGRARQGSDIWLVAGDGTPELAYSGSNPWMLRPAWSPDGQRLLVDMMIPRRRGSSFRDSGADVVVLDRAPRGSPAAMTWQVLYRSDRHFDWAGNLAWSPDGTRIAVRTGDGIAEISSDNGRVLAAHPQRRGNSGWLIWLECQGRSLCARGELNPHTLSGTRT